MPSHSTHLIAPERDTDATVRLHWYLLQMLPITLAVVLGPLIAVGYRLTQPADAAHGSLSIAQVVRGLLAILMLLSLYFSRGLHLFTHRLVRPLLFVAAYAILTSFARPYPYQDLVFAVRLVFITAILVSAMQLAQRGLVSQRWLTTCAWTILLTMALCIGMALVAGSTVSTYRSRYATAGFTNHPAVASCLVLSTLPVLIRDLSVGRLALAGLGIFYALLFFTMRRSALIAATLATCCSLLINLNPLGDRLHRRRTLLAFGVLLLLAGIGLSTTAGTDLMARFRGLNPREGSGSGRYIIWRIALEHITHRPTHVQLWGEGKGSIRDLMKQHFGLAIGSHNDWLDAVHAFGWYGLIGIGWWYSELARFVWHLRDEKEGLFQGACAAVVVLGLISIGTAGSLSPPWALSYATIGFWAGHTEYAKQGRCAHND